MPAIPTACIGRSAPYTARVPPGRYAGAGAGPGGGEPDGRRRGFGSTAPRRLFRAITARAARNIAPSSTRSEGLPSKFRYTASRHSRACPSANCHRLRFPAIIGAARHEGGYAPADRRAANRCGGVDARAHSRKISAAQHSSHRCSSRRQSQQPAHCRHSVGGRQKPYRLCLGRPSPKSCALAAPL